MGVFLFGIFLGNLRGDEASGPSKKGEEPLSERDEPSGSVKAAAEWEAAGLKACPGTSGSSAWLSAGSLEV